jgi:hypothetical protein
MQLRMTIIPSTGKEYLLSLYREKITEIERAATIGIAIHVHNMVSKANRAAATMSQSLLSNEKYSEKSIGVISKISSESRSTFPADPMKIAGIQIAKQKMVQSAV